MTACPTRYRPPQEHFGYEVVEPSESCMTVSEHQGASGSDAAPPPVVGHFREPLTENADESRKSEHVLARATTVVLRVLTPSAGPSRVLLTEARCLGSHTIMLSLPCMHHALSESRSQTFGRDTPTDMNPSTTRAGSLPDAAQHRPLDVRQPRDAARAAQKHRRRPRVLLTAYAPRCSGSTLDTLDRCQRPRSASPGDLLPVLDASSAEPEGEDTVVLNVMATQTGPRNTCNVKARST